MCEETLSIMCSMKNERKIKYPKYFALDIKLDWDWFNWQGIYCQMRYDVIGHYL